MNTLFSVASPDVSSVKTVTPLQVTSPDFLPAPNLRHAPAFWDLNEAGDAATAFGTVKPSDNNHLYEEPFASAGGKTDSSQYSGVNPVASDDDDVNIQCPSTNKNFDHPSAMGDCSERNSSTFSPFVAKTPETGQWSCLRTVFKRTVAAPCSIFGAKFCGLNSNAASIHMPPIGKKLG